MDQIVIPPREIRYRQKPCQGTHNGDMDSLHCCPFQQTVYLVQNLVPLNPIVKSHLERALVAG